MDKILNTDKEWEVQEFVGVPNLTSFPSEAITNKLESIAPGYGANINIVIFLREGEEDYYVYDRKHFEKVCEKIENNPDQYYKLFDLWEKKINIYYSLIKTLDPIQSKNLLEDYKKFIKAYIDEYSPALITEFITVLASDQMFLRLCEKHSPDKANLLHKLVLPKKSSFLQEEELSLLKIALKLKNHKDIKKLSGLKEKNSEIYKEVQKHQQSFFWIQNNYKHTKPLTTEHFWYEIQKTVSTLEILEINKKIKEIETYEENIKKEKEEIYKKFDISEEDCEKFELIALNGYWHDLRKKANLIADHYCNLFLRALSEQTDYKFKELQFATYKEILKLLGGVELPKKILNERMKHAVHLIGPEVEEQILTGNAAEQITKGVLKMHRSKYIKELKGMPACPGRVKGKVRIVNNPQDKLEQGEILVTSMTRPELVPLIKKAGAIVTNEGGITSHAAIVSRELGVPCIIGTKVATQVLKNGDIIEVDANHGVVKILKKA